MTTLRTAAQQALEALEEVQKYGTTTEWFDERVSALRAALAEPVQEPVAWLATDCIGERDLWFSPPLDGDQVLPLYAAPPQHKPLSEDEIAQAMYRADAIFTGPMQFRFAREIERAHGIT